MVPPIENKLPECKDASKLKHCWRAQWITHPSASTLDARKFLFRRRFELDSVPEAFPIRLSADNRYRLYVNGEYVASGPSSGDLANYRFDTLDIAHELAAGSNIIAVEVVNFGEFRKASTMTFQTALILEGDMHDVVDIDTGQDKGWAVICDGGFDVIPFTKEDFGAYYAAGPGEKLNAGSHPWGWRSIGFDDSSWLEPRPATVEFAAGRGFVFGSTWFLVPRAIPMMEETPQRFADVARADGIDATGGFIHGEAGLVMPPNRDASILLDQKHHTIGHPLLRFSGGKGSTIRITYAEALHDDLGRKGDRNDFAGKQVSGYYDLIEADGGKNREFWPLGQRTYRFVQLDISTKDEALRIDDYHGIYTAYPFEENAKFETDDLLLKAIWDVSWRTLRNSAVEGFIDPYYEQLQYIGDTRIAALASLSVSGDDRLMRNAIKSFDDSRLPMGLTASRYPSYIVQVIPTFSLMWINMVHDFHMYRDDDEFVRQFIPGIRAVLEWWSNNVDASGMPTRLEWWNFTDWSHDFENGVPDGAEDGYSSCIALQLVGALQNASELFAHLGLEQDAVQYASLEQQIRDSVIRQCYAEDSGMVAETPDKRRFSQHTNILAILTDAVPQKRQRALMQRILDDRSLIQATMYFRFYMFNALQKSGLGDLYLGLLDDWKECLDKGLTTFPETVVESRSDCHAWSASPNFHFLKIVAGIYPGNRHFDQIIVEPKLGGLKAVKATVPHPKGEVSVDLRISPDGISGEIVLPEGTDGLFKWNDEVRQLGAGRQRL